MDKDKKMKGTEGEGAKRVVEQFEKARKTVRGEIQDYWLNSAFLEGHQWVYFNTQSNRIDTYAGDPERVQAVMNRIWPAQRTTISKLTQRALTFEVMPSAPDDATMRGASTAEAILHDVHVRHRWESLRTRNALSTWLGGTAAICVDWDPSLGNQVDQDKFEGDTVETPLAISEFVVEPGSRDPVTARWWIKSQTLPPAQVKATYKMDKEPPADAFSAEVAGTERLQKSRNESQRPDLTRVLTYYERPNGSSPKGSVAVVVDGKYVFGPKPWPFPFKDRLNLAITYETPRDQEWSGVTVVTAARPVQVLLNLAESNVAEHMKNAGNARMGVPQSTMDLMDTFSDLPGEMFPFPDGSNLPAWIAPPPMPNWWAEWPAKLREELDDLLGVHDISRGAAPANIESGYGLSILAEHDSTPVGRMIKSQAEAWSQVATMVLELYSSMVKETRKAMIRVPGDVPEVVPWSGKELHGQTTAVVPEDAIVPRSRAGLQAMAEKMVQMGLIQDVETFAALSELPDQKEMLARSRPDAAKARRENSMLALGRPQVPADFDEHEVHIAEHNVFRKSTKYERLEPDARVMVDEHIQAHSTMAAELAGRSRQAAAVDPMLAASPQADARPTLDPEQLPPEAFQMADPAEEEAAMLAALAEQSANL